MPRAIGLYPCQQSPSHPQASLVARHHQHLDERAAEKVPVRHRIGHYLALYLGHQATVMPEPVGNLPGAPWLLAREAVQRDQGGMVLSRGYTYVHGAISDNGHSAIIDAQALPGEAR